MLFTIVSRSHHGHARTPHPHGQAQLFGVEGCNGSLHRIFIILSDKVSVKTKIQTGEILELLRIVWNFQLAFRVFFI